MVVPLSSKLSQSLSVSELESRSAIKSAVSSCGWQAITINIQAHAYMYMYIIPKLIDDKSSGIVTSVACGASMVAVDVWDVKIISLHVLSMAVSGASGQATCTCTIKFNYR